MERGRPGSRAPAARRLTRCAAHTWRAEPVRSGTLRSVTDIARPALEGTVAVRDGRRLSFAEFGRPRGAAIIWMHGTPGARRQIPLEARRYAEEHGVRIIGVDRPGIGSSTPYLYGESSTGPATSSCCRRAGDRHLPARSASPAAAPTCSPRARDCPSGCTGWASSAGWRRPAGPDAVGGGADPARRAFAPLLNLARVPLGIALTQGIRLVRPLAGTALDLYAAVQPPGDKNLLSRPEFKAMFVDDLLNGSRFQTSAPALRPAAVHARLGVHRRRRLSPGALVARRRGPHRPPPPRPAHGRQGCPTPRSRRSTARATSAGWASPSR